MCVIACNQCSVEIEGKGIHFRGQVFCGDECCEEFEAEFADQVEPDLENFDEDLEEEIVDTEDLGYRSDDDLEEDDFDNDDLEIRPEDF